MKKSTLVIVLSLSFLTLPLSSSAEGLFARMSTKYENVKVERVIKSDLIQLDSGEKVRLIGLKAFDAPRKYDVERDKYGFVIEDFSDPTIPLEDQAYDFARWLMEHKKVRVEFDTQSVDENGASWGYVFLEDKTMANVEIIRQGFAELQIRPPNLKYADQLRKAYHEARSEKRGIQANQ